MSWIREADRNRSPATGSSSRSGGGFGEVWKCEAPGGIHKAIKFVFGNLNSLDVDGGRPSQEFKRPRARQGGPPPVRPVASSGSRSSTANSSSSWSWPTRASTTCFEECQPAGLVGIPRDDAARATSRDAAEALDYMNEKHNLQHLDVKPRNLFLVGDRVKVADFGLVKHLERPSASGIMGGVTPLYAAPETFAGKISPAQRPVQPRDRLPGAADRPAAVHRQERSASWPCST